MIANVSLKDEINKADCHLCINYVKNSEVML